MYLSLVMVPRPDWPGRFAEYVLSLPPDSALRRWSHERWLVAGLFGFIGASLVAIVPGVSQSLRGPAATAPARISLALPLPKAKELGAATRSGWQFVRVRSGETLGLVFEQMKLPATLVHRLLDEYFTARAKAGRGSVRQEKGGRRAKVHLENVVPFAL